MDLRIFLFLIFIFGCSENIFGDTDKYRLIVLDDPATTITIAWNQISGVDPIVYYDEIDFGSDHTQYSFSKSVDRVSNAKGMSNQFARLSGLKPNTAYYFVINDSEGTSNRFWFITAPDDNSRLFFIAGGDSRNNRTPRQRANLLVSKLKPHAVGFGGDMTDDDTNLEWQNWFDDWQLTTAQDGRMFPIFPARGNHENRTSIYDLFDTPNTDSYYAITWGENLIRTYTLNSEISVLGNQLNWLESDLTSSSDVIWKMAQYHKPMRPHTAGKSEGDNQYEAWAQLFYDNDLRLVVDCDSHMSKTTWPIRPSSEPGNDEGFVIDQLNGTVYTGEGCWGAPLRPNDDDKSWTRNSGSFNQFKVIFVDPEKIELRTININNAVSVTESSNSDPFTLPQNLDVFSSESGDVVIISNEINNPCQLVGTPCDDGNNETLFDELDGFCNCIGLNSVELVEETVVITSSSDDAEETVATGMIDLNSSDLELIYDEGEQLVGVRFENVQIPEGATLYRSYLQFQTDEIEMDQDPTNIIIHGELAPSSQPFTEDLFNISTRTRTKNNIVWNNIDLWDAIDEAGIKQRSPYVTPIVQEIINQSNWNSGSPITFIISGSGKRVAESFDGSGGGPILKLFYQSPCNPKGSPCDDGDINTIYDLEDGNCNCAGIPVEGTLIYQVSNGSDDAEEEVATGEMYLESSDLELIAESGTTDQYVGIRFTNIQLPRDAKITNAYIQFTVDNDNTGLTNLIIKTEMSTNSQSFTDEDFNISRRNTGIQSVNWDNVPPWTTIGLAGPNQRTPNLAPIIEEILSQEDWGFFNPITFIISGSGEREAESFDGTAPPELVIEYKIEPSSTEEQKFHEVQIYPNPANDYLNVSAVEVIDRITLYDFNGKHILSKVINEKECSLKTGSINPGVYMIKIQVDKKIYSRKVIFE